MILADAFTPQTFGGAFRFIADNPGLLAEKAVEQLELAGAALGVALLGAVDVEAAQGLIRAQLGLTEAESARVGAIAGGLIASAWGMRAPWLVAGALEMGVAALAARALTIDRA